MRFRVSFAAFLLVAACSSPNSDGVSEEDAGTDGAPPVADTNSPKDTPGLRADTSPIDVHDDFGQKDAAVDAPTVDAPPAGANGAACSSAGACTSGFCVDGVCCNSECSGSCLTCKSGTCASTPKGTAPLAGRAVCAKDDASTCKGNGLCDGTGKCDVYGTDTACKAETCANGTATPSAKCDGKGACKDGSPSSCGNFTCDGPRCATTCQGSTSCVATAYCAGTTCQPRKALGSTCKAVDECAGGATCGGRCCSTPCTCPQPSPENLFKNPGFDNNSAAEWGEAGIQWNQADADGCPYSGSGQVFSASGAPAQCVRVVGGTLYVFGFWIKTTNTFGCYPSFFDSTDCSGDGVEAPTISGKPPTADWTPRSVDLPAPSTAKSMRFYCDTVGALFDKFMLSTKNSY